MKCGLGRKHRRIPGGAVDQLDIGIVSIATHIALVVSDHILALLYLQNDIRTSSVCDRRDCVLPGA